MAERRPPKIAVDPALTPPPGNPRFPLLDSLRAVAALSVLLSHAAGASGLHQDLGDAGGLVVHMRIGVTMFFLLSGFLLYRPFVAARLDSGKAPRLRDYARRRTLRIVPAYWVALTVLAIYPGLYGVFTDQWWVYYFFGQAYSPYTLVGGIGPAWSLCIEVTFYAAMPVYALALTRIGPRLGRSALVRLDLVLLAILACASIVLRSYVGARDPTSTIAFTLAGTFYWFALGMAMAVISVAVSDGRPRPRALRLVDERPLWIWIAAFILFACMSTLLGLPTEFTKPYTQLQSFLEHILYGLIAVLILLPGVFGDRRGGLPRQVLAWPLLAWLGLISYGIFLWQLPWILQLRDWGLVTVVPHLGFLVLTAAAVAVTIACASASYYLVERPILRFKDPRPRAGGGASVDRGRVPARARPS